MSDSESGEEIIDEVSDEVESSDEEESSKSGSDDDSSDDTSTEDYYDLLDPMEVKQTEDYPMIKYVLRPDQRRTNKDYLDQMETAQLVATFTQMISNHNYIPPINTDGYDDPRDIAIKAIQERGLGRKKQTIPITIERRLPPVIDSESRKIIQYVEHIDPNDTAIALPFLPPLKELSKAL
jgi:hypothetical protein